MRLDRLAVPALLLSSFFFAAEAERLLIVHVNDTHGHALPYGDDDDLGGMARMASVVKQEKASEPNTLFLNGGDTFEGTLFFNTGMGQYDFELMEMMTPTPGTVPGLDGLVMGNHDFALGTQQLYDSFTASGATYPYFAANINLTGVSRVLDPIIVGNYTDGVQDATPYVVKTMPNGVRVGMFGLVTSETTQGEPKAGADGVVFYNVTSTPSVYQIAQGIVDRLRNVEGVDVVVMLSHLSLDQGTGNPDLEDDTKIAQNVTGIDVIIGGHDHAARPMITDINGTRCVYAGAESRYVGLLDLDVDTTLGTVATTSYELRELTSATALDPAVETAIAGYLPQVEAMYPEAYTDLVGRNTTFFESTLDAESGLGNLTTDSYRAATGADIAIDPTGTLRFDGFRGWWYPADSFRVKSIGFDPAQGDVLSLTEVTVFGNAGGIGGGQPLLQAVLELLVSDLLQATLPSTQHVQFSGVSFDYDPQAADFSKITNITIDGAAFDPGATYTAAVPGRLAQEAIPVMDLLFSLVGQPNELASNSMSTGVRPWTALTQRIDAVGRTTCAHNVVQGRTRTIQPDLGFVGDCGVDVEPRAFVPNGSVTTTIEVMNFGMTDSSTTVLQVQYEESPDDTLPNWITVDTIPVPSVLAYASGVPGRVTVTTTFTMPAQLAAGVYPVRIVIEPDPNETVITNNQIDIVSPPRGNFLTALGPGPANASQIDVFDADGTSVCQFFAYAAGGYGADVASGDINGLAPGRDEALTAPGPGAVYGPQIRAFDVTTCPPSSLAKVNFYAYGTLRFGARVDAGDVDGDGHDEILTGAGAGAVFGPHVRGWNFDGQSLSPINRINFFAFQTLKYGADVAAGDIDGDGYWELLVAPGPGQVFASTIRGFNVDGGSVSGMAKVNFTASTSYFGGAVDAGDTEGDGYDEIFTASGPDPAASSRVRVFDFDAQQLGLSFEFTPFASSYGASVGPVNRDGLPWDEVLAGPGADPAATACAAAYRTSLRDPANVTSWTPPSCTGPAYGTRVHGGHFGW